MRKKFRKTYLFILIFITCFLYGCNNPVNRHSLISIKRNLKNKLLFCNWDLVEISDNYKKYHVVGYDCNKLNNMAINEYLTLKLINDSTTTYSKAFNRNKYLYIYFVPKQIQIKRSNTNENISKLYISTNLYNIYVYSDLTDDKLYKEMIHGIINFVEKNESGQK